MPRPTRTEAVRQSSRMICRGRSWGRCAGRGGRRQADLRRPIRTRPLSPRRIHPCPGGPDRGGVLTPMAQRNPEDVQDVILSIDGIARPREPSMAGVEVIPASVPRRWRAPCGRNRADAAVLESSPSRREPRRQPASLDPQSIAPGIGAGAALAALRQRRLQRRMGGSGRAASRADGGRPRIIRKAETGGRNFSGGLRREVFRRSRGMRGASVPPFVAEDAVLHPGVGALRCPGGRSPSAAKVSA